MPMIRRLQRRILARAREGSPERNQKKNNRGPARPNPEAGREIAHAILVPMKRKAA